MKLPTNLETIRKYFRENQSAFGERYGVGRSAVSKWEAGENEPPLRVLMDLEDRTGVPLSRMLRDDITMEELDGQILQEPPEPAKYEKSTNMPQDMAAILEAVQALRALTEAEREAAAVERSENIKFRKKIELLEKRLEMLDSEVAALVGKKRKSS